MNSALGLHTSLYGCFVHVCLWGCFSMYDISVFYMSVCWDVLAHISHWFFVHVCLWGCFNMYHIVFWSHTEEYLKNLLFSFGL